MSNNELIKCECCEHAIEATNDDGIVSINFWSSGWMPYASRWSLAWDALMGRAYGVSEVILSEDSVNRLIENMKGK